MPESIPMRLRRWATYWHHEGEWEPDGETTAYAWEPLDAAGITEDARPYCYGLGEVDFYDRTGNRVLLKRCRYHHLSGAANDLLLLGSRWYEVCSGQILYRPELGWYMRWWCRSNTRAAEWANRNGVW